MRQPIQKLKSHSNSLFYFQDGDNYGTNDKIKKEKSVKQGLKTSQETIMNTASS